MKYPEVALRLTEMWLAENHLCGRELAATKKITVEQIQKAWLEFYKTVRKAEME